MTAAIQDRSSLIDKVVFLRVSFGVPGNTKKVKGEEVLNTDGDKDMFKVQKTLLDSPELEAIKKADGRIYNWLRGLCLPYDQGFMMLPHGLTEDVDKQLTHYATVDRPALVKTFVEVYPDRYKEAAMYLGSQFNPSDYASPESVSDKFYFHYQYLSFAPAETFASQEMREKADKQFQEKLTQVSDEITVLMRGTLLDLVQHLKEALEPSGDGKKKRLFASTVTNIQDFLNTFKARNITNDAELEKVVNELAVVIHPGFSVDTLKNDDVFKKEFHGTMENMTSKLVSLTEVIPGRKFKNVE